MAILVNGNFHINPLEVTTRQAIPSSDGLADGFRCFCLLNAVVPDSPSYNFSRLGELMVGPHSHKRAGSYAVRCLENYRARPSAPEEILDDFRHIMKIVLRSTGPSASDLCLLKMH